MQQKFNGAAGRQEIYARVTASMIADLEQGVRPWAKPWRTAHQSGRIMRPLRHNGEPYSGINVLLLWSSALDHGFASSTWMTFLQAKELDAHVRKGERGSPVVYTGTMVKEHEDEQGDLVEREIRFLKSYTVFNVEQIAELPSHYYEKPPAPVNPAQRIDQAEAFFRATKADIRSGGVKAFYDPAGDFIKVPPLETFQDVESFYATLAHETVHWTRHGSRLARDFGQKSWGDEGYAREELVAELGAAYLCADLDLAPVIREDHAAYVASWLKVLKEDTRAIFSAAAHAQRAVDYLHVLQPARSAPAFDATPSPEAKPPRPDTEPQLSLF